LKAKICQNILSYDEGKLKWHFCKNIGKRRKYKQNQAKPRKNKEKQAHDKSTFRLPRQEIVGVSINAVFTVLC